MYRRCISTLGCPDLDLDATLALAARERLDTVELRALSGSIDLPSVFASAYGSPQKLAEHLATASVPIRSLDTSLSLATATAADREAFLLFVPWAEALGVPWLRVFDGGHDATAATHRAMAETVTWWRTQREQNRWRCDIMVETHDALRDSRAIQQFLALAPATAILWDTHHTWHTGGEDPAATWHAIKGHVVHVHVKDSIARASAKHPFTFVLPGDGLFPMATLRPILQAGFTGAVSLEWERLWHPYLPPLKEALGTATSRGWW